MSSRVEGAPMIAAAVIAPAAVAFGAGWIAWQSGKLLVAAGVAIVEDTKEKMRRMEEEERHRKMVAVSAHDQLAAMCSQILSQLDSEHINGGDEGVEQLRHDLAEICSEYLPDDVSQIESLTTSGYLKLDSIVRQKERIAQMSMSGLNADLAQGISVAGLMEELRIAINAMEVRATRGTDVAAPDPAVVERMKLNEEFAGLTAQIMEALETIKTFSAAYGLSESDSAWFHSCFDGVDELIGFLCRANTSNAELKKGLKRLKRALEQYQIFVKSTEKELNRKVSLYGVYVDASKALGEKVLSIKQFSDSSEIEDRLRALQERAKRAKKCAEIYKKLGPAAYLCYAWDQELGAMGYKVHSREKISEMSGADPARAKLGEHKLPFYQWSDSDLTQLYSLTSLCALQVIVHDDGTVSMQTIADTAEDEVVDTQRLHCEQLKVLYKRLRENWFIFYDYEETESPEEITTVSQWRTTAEDARRTRDDSKASGYRRRKKKEEKADHMQ